MALVYRAPDLNSTESGGHGINGRGNGVNAGVPKGYVNHLPPHLERIIIPFFGTVKVAA
jgi:hypothetical protein